MSMSSAASKGRVVFEGENDLVRRCDPTSRHQSGGGGGGDATKRSKKKLGKKMSRRKRIMVPCSCWPQPIQDLVKSTMADDPKDRPTMKHVRETLEGCYLSLTRPPTSPAEQDEHAGPYYEMQEEEMHLSKRQRRRSTFRLETWTKEVMQDFLEEGDDDDDGDDAFDERGDDEILSCRRNQRKRRPSSSFDMKQLSQTSHISQSTLGSNEDTTKIDEENDACIEDGQ
jgi:hypothetical protein